MPIKSRNSRDYDAPNLKVFLNLSFQQPCTELIISLRELNTASPEVIHQTRVAIRTIQSYLEAFDNVLKPKHRRDFHHWLRGLHQSLQCIRELDVFSELISSHEVVVLNRRIVFEEIERRRALEAANLAQQLTPELVMECVHKVEVFTSTLPIRTQVSNMNSRAQFKLLINGIEKVWASFLANSKKSLIGSSPSHRHKLRISAKNVRYVCELSNRMGIANHPKRLLRAIELQNKLGLENDIYNFQKWLRCVAPGKFISS